MISWRFLPGEELELYSPIGLRLVDDLTGGAPIGRVKAHLDVQDGAEWRALDSEAVITASSIVTYPGLGRSVDLAPPPQHYRVRLEARCYRPSYRLTGDGIAFDAPLYDDANPPAPLTAVPAEAALLPSAAYPFAPYVPVLHGLVVDPGGDPVADVLVQEGLRERVLTDERGVFSLPLRWVAEGVPTAISADDQRNARAGAINVTLPAALDQSQTITVA